MRLDEITHLVVHHSASARDTSTDAIREWHVRDRGWADIGYHWVIEGDGRLHAGRPLDRQGAHAYPRNRRTWGVCVVGDNTSPTEGWNGAQKTALRNLAMAVRLLLPQEIAVVGHGHLTPGRTQCPGLMPVVLETIVGPDGVYS